MEDFLNKRVIVVQGCYDGIRGVIIDGQVGERVIVEVDKEFGDRAEVNSRILNHKTLTKIIKDKLYKSNNGYIIIRKVQYSLNLNAYDYFIKCLPNETTIQISQLKVNNELINVIAIEENSNKIKIEEILRSIESL